MVLFSLSFEFTVSFAFFHNSPVSQRFCEIHSETHVFDAPKTHIVVAATIDIAPPSGTLSLINALVRIYLDTFTFTSLFQ